MVLCVFCGARHGNDPDVISAVSDFGRQMVASNIGLVYGGGSTGLMGVIADSVLKAGGRVTGIIPDFLAHEEVLHQSIDKTMIVADLFERKTKMIQRSDAFVALPGGMGTFDELLEVFTWRQLNQLRIPIGIFNYQQYFDPLIALLTHAETAGFYDMAYLDEVIITSEPAELIAQLLDKRSA